MANKEKEREKEKTFVSVFKNLITEIKILVSAILLVCSVFYLLQFSANNRSFCSSSTSEVLLVPPSSQQPSIAKDEVTEVLLVPPSSQQPSIAKDEITEVLLVPPSSQEPSIAKDEVTDVGGVSVLKRTFHPYGAAAYTFIHMSTYRGGLNTFAVIGLASKPLHLYAKPLYKCEWIPCNQSSSSITTDGFKILPDWGYGRVYTVVVVNCTFPVPVGVDGDGGRLVLHASTGGGGDWEVDSTERIEALREGAGELDTSIFSAPPLYDYLYCGSPLYGNLSPQRVREWLAYHVKLFGEKSHFVIYDAGGVHPGVLEVLKPWIEKGYVTLQDVRMQERFDGYYHNQFLVVNDCLHRYRFMAKWMFFFDVDEFIYVAKKNTIQSIVDSNSGYTQFTIEQVPMSNKLCLDSDAGRTARQWGFEKLVYRDVKKGIRRDRKYAIQPRNVLATGVHLSQNVVGRTQHKLNGRIRYYHFHGTISERREPCRQFVNETELTFEKNPYYLDTTLRDAAASVKSFEFRSIGSALQRTRQ